MVNSKSVHLTVEEQDILKHDLVILEAMTAGMADYLASDVTWWDMGQGDMPMLTIGGYLMRRSRLTILEELLRAPDRVKLTAANAVYDSVVSGQVVRFEERALAELGARLREWTVYLRDLAVSKRLAADTERYSYLVDTRVVLGELVNKLSESPYRLPEHIPADVAALDLRLKSRWKHGAFVWSPIWKLTYPSDPYWWLYGHHRVD